MKEIKQIRKEHPYWFWFVTIASMFNGIGLVLVLLSEWLWEEQFIQIK